jgi:hypothetical protein
MIAVFFGLGFLLWFRPSFMSERLPPENRPLLIFLLFAYGIFRGYRSLKKFRHDQEE